MTTGQWACLELIGPDSVKFLQGQLTADVSQIGSERGALSALCTPKGRIVSNFYLLPLPGGQATDLLIAIPSETAELTVSTLAKYIVFSKAELTLAEQWQVDFVSLDAPIGDTYTARLGPHSVELQIASEPSLALRAWHTEHEQAQAALDNNSAAFARIYAGLGIVQAATSDTFVPQMLNMERCGGISFEKGCYTGQEIVARAQYRGKIKRRMVRLSVDGAIEAGAGSALVNGDGKAFADVVETAEHEGRTQLLAVMNRALFDEQPHIESQFGTLQVHSLPYALDDPADSE